MMDKNNGASRMEHSKISLDDLRMKQSVRTTFKLPEEAINLLTIIAGQLGIKQKSLLDQLTEDSSLLVKLATEVKQRNKKDERRYAKTFVMSRNALQSINDVAKKQKISRDILVELSIKRLLPIIEGELKKHTERKQIIEKMQQLAKHEETLRDQARKVLGKDDHLFEMIDSQVKLAQKNIAAAGVIIKKGMPMEEW
jgi:hypothetical protein